MTKFQEAVENVFLLSEDEVEENLSETEDEVASEDEKLEEND